VNIAFETLRRQLPNSRTILFATAIGCLIFSGCARKHRRAASIPNAPQPPYSSGRRQTTPAPAIAIGYSEEGIASWYGIPYHGRQAADGEIYDMETLVAAHRTMPFNTWLKVTNLSNSKSVNVRIIDRGPFIDGRILDLSKAAAREIELLGPGIGRIRLEVVAAPADIPSEDFYAVQVGAFSVAANAERARAALAERFGNAQIVMKAGKAPLWRVLVGKEPSVTAAQQLANVLSVENKDVFVVRLDEKASAPLPLAPPPAPAVSTAPASPSSEDPQAPQ
jgi:rare lipoprotein A